MSEMPGEVTAKVEMARGGHGGNGDRRGGDGRGGGEGQGGDIHRHSAGSHRESRYRRRHRDQSQD